MLQFHTKWPTVASVMGHDREKGGEENVAEVNTNIVGMNAFLFPMEFLHFGRKIPSLLHF